MSFLCSFIGIYSVYILFFNLCDHLWKVRVVVSSNSNIMISTLFDFSTLRLGLSHAGRTCNPRKKFFFQKLYKISFIFILYVYIYLNESIISYEKSFLLKKK